MKIHEENKLAVKADWKPVVRAHAERGDNCPWLPARAFEGHDAEDYRDINLRGETRPEQWKPLPSLNGNNIPESYEISSHGRGRSIKRVSYAAPRNGTCRQSKNQQPEPRIYPGKMLKAKIDDGKARFSLTIGGKVKCVTVSRLMYETFVGPIAEGQEIDHINRNPQDNHLSNLRCVSRSQNLANKGPLTSDSGYVGVHRHPRGGYETVIHYNKKEVGKKVSRNPIICAIFHDIISKQYNGEHVNLNFPDGLPEGYTERDAFRPELELGVKVPLIGVTKVGKRFRAHVHNKERTFIDQWFDDPIEAAVARDKALLEMTKRTPRLNFSTVEDIGLYDSIEEARAAIQAHLHRGGQPSC